MLLLILTDFITASAQEQQLKGSKNSLTAQESPFPALAEAVTVNNLPADGKPPFHLKLSFQVFDVSGKPEEQGTLDDWWAGPEGSYVEVSAPSLGTLHTLWPSDLPSDESRRTLYLVRDLLDAVQAPYGTVPLRGKLVSDTKTEGKLVLNCMHVEREGSHEMTSAYETACVDETTKTIRIVSGWDKTSLRNRTATFGPTRVALDVQVSYLGRQAITGKVEALEAFHPATSPVVLDRAATPAASESANAGGASGAVIPARRLKGADLSFPQVAREHGIAGKVILAVHITNAGDVGAVLPIASVDPILANTSMEAVKTWTFAPATLNGKPVPTDMTLSVSFNQIGIDSWH